ncbi:hypothetical protein [Frigidibacter oleivorans]|uniref:hypothetical protein n=1 Tax=Frigidibacter oleivorans TaxID=2487129 RepID=UPI000F8F7B19|nr:hypothetical protein [Frigidibacter oleivorans]
MTAFSQPLNFNERSICSMAAVLTPDEIAHRIDAPLQVVVAVLAKARLISSRRWAGMNLKTGRVIHGLTERSVYLRVQIAGWTDWCFVDPAAVEPAAGEPERAA